jgi:LPS export ABC transporter permease LptG
MKIIVRYVTKSLLLPVLVSFIAFYFLALIYDLFDSLGDLVNSHAGAWPILEYYTVQIPRVAQQIIPYAFFFSCLYCLANLSRTREAIALQAGGIGLATISLPFFLIAFALAGIQYYFFLDLSPKSETRRRAIEERIKGHEQEAQHFGPVVYKNPENGVLWTIQEVNLQDGSIGQTEILYLDKIGRDQLKLYITSGSYSRDHSVWEFKGVRKVQFNPAGGLPKVEMLPEMLAEDLQETPEDLVAMMRKPGEMGWGELGDFIFAPYQPAPHRMGPYRTEYYRRMAYPLLCPVLCLFALAFGVTHSRFNMVISIFNSIFVMALLIVWLEASVALGSGRRLPPFFAAWNTIFLFGSAGFLLYANKVGWLWNWLYALKSSPPVQMKV